MSGAADVINAQGQMMVSQQQAFLMKEQVRSSKIDNRRKALDESLYERAVTPTMEDERERLRLESVRRSRNNPTPTEIWSATALNNLLGAIQRQQAQRIEGPPVAVDGDTLRHINMTGGRSDGSLALLRNGGRLDWPLALMDDAFESNRKNLEALCTEAFRQVQSGAVQSTTVRGMRKTIDTIQADLRKNVKEIPPNDYIAAKRFVNEMNGTIRSLQDPSVGNYSAPRWPPSGTTVPVLTQQMTKQGLRFAPAVPGDEAAYNALHSAMVAYYSPDPARQWDPYAK
jgi:hypothetical protein